MVLSHITYDDGTNGTRPLFYRLSVAEMVVPVSFAASNRISDTHETRSHTLLVFSFVLPQYAKTTFPHHRKQAFDTGEYGIGALANSLALGCDCKGKIAYLDFDMVGDMGAHPQYNRIDWCFTVQPKG